MAGEELSTNDAILELTQARRSFQIFENAEQVCRYLLTVEQKQKDAEAVLAKVQADADALTASLAERIRTGELRAEDAERRAAEIEKQIAEKVAKADQLIAEAKAQLTKEVEAAQQKVKAAKAELADLQKKITAAKAELADLLKKIADAKKTLEATK